MTMASTPSRAFAVWWKDLDRWNVDYFHSARWHWPTSVLKRLADFTTAEAKLIATSDAQAQGIPIIAKINFGGVLFLRGSDDYEDYKGRLFIVSPDRLIFSKINAKRGCIYFSAADQKPFAVSSEYPVLKLDTEKALGDYVNLAMRVGPAREALLGSASGMAKARTNLEDFQNIKIPLPPLAVQKAIVARWRKAQDEIAAAWARVEKRTIAIDARFFADLGLQSPDQLTMPKAFAVWWEDFLRWGVRFNQLSQGGADITQGKYPVSELDSVLDIVQYGTSEKANSTGKGVPVLRIGNIKNRSLDLSDLKHIPLPKKTFEGLLLRDGDILIIRTSGSRDLVGTCAVFRGEGDFVFASYLIRLRFNPDKIVPEFVSWFLNSSLGRQQVDAVSRQIMQNNINSEELRSLQTPLPPLTVQQKIMERVASGRAEITRERETAKNLSKAINAEVEALILGTKSLKDA